MIRVFCICLMVAGHSARVLAEDLPILWAPRAVAGAPSSDPVILVPGTPGHLLRLRGGSWQKAASDLPSWATSGLIIGDKLWLIGSEGGRFHAEIRSFSS